MEKDFILPYLSYETFHYFFSALSQSLAALVALIAVFHVYRYPKIFPKCVEIIQILIDKSNFAHSHDHSRDPDKGLTFWNSAKYLSRIRKLFVTEDVEQIKDGKGDFMKEKDNIEKEFQKDYISTLLNIKIEHKDYNAFDHLRLIKAYWPKLEQNIELIISLPKKVSMTIRLLLISLLLSLITLLLNDLLANFTWLLIGLIICTISISIYSCLQMYQYIKDSL